MATQSSFPSQASWAELSAIVVDVAEVAAQVMPLNPEQGSPENYRVYQAGPLEFGCDVHPSGISDYYLRNTDWRPWRAVVASADQSIEPVVLELGPGSGTQVIPARVFSRMNRSKFTLCPRPVDIVPGNAYLLKATLNAVLFGTFVHAFPKFDVAIVKAPMGGGTQVVLKQLSLQETLHGATLKVHDAMGNTATVVLKEPVISDMLRFDLPGPIHPMPSYDLDIELKVSWNAQASR